MYHVLLIDDEEWSLKVSNTIFPWEEYGFEVAFVTDRQEEALEFIDTHKIDVIVLDMCMPGMSGENMLKEIRNRTGAKIVILSGYSLFTYAQHAIDYGVFAYCLKPINEEKARSVTARLKKALDSENNHSETIEHKPEIENYKFSNLVKYIETHYREKLYLNSLAKKFDINLTYCCQLFNKHFNMSFSDYVTDFKMKKAQDMIEYENMEIDEIADELNYDYVYFCKLFKKHFNKTPRQYRKECMNNKK